MILIVLIFIEAVTNYYTLTGSKQAQIYCFIVTGQKSVMQFQPKTLTSCTPPDSPRKEFTSLSSSASRDFEFLGSGPFLHLQSLFSSLP
jgi:hypothetical protein